MGLSENQSLAYLLNTANLLQCPICTLVMDHPIYQCSNGHRICSDCKKQVQDSCPTCRQRLGNIRCRALEEMAESLKLPCEYKEYGCPRIIYFDKIDKHQESCYFKPYKCPYPVCSDFGDVASLVSHLTNHHKVPVLELDNEHNRGIFNREFDIYDPKKEVIVFKCYTKFFCLHFESVGIESFPLYLVFLRFMGNEKDAGRYRYSLEIGGNDRGLTFQGTPRSIRESYEMIVQEFNGLPVLPETVHSLGGAKLLVGGRISRARENPNV